jgi:hypothetical protein
MKLYAIVDLVIMHIFIINTTIHRSAVDIIFLFHFKKFNKSNELFNECKQ